jgi:hypothetical protein
VSIAAAIPLHGTFSDTCMRCPLHECVAHMHAGANTAVTVTHSAPLACGIAAADRAGRKKTDPGGVHLAGYVWRNARGCTKYAMVTC